MLATSTTFPNGVPGAHIPLAPGLAALSIPERMVEVIRRQQRDGQPTTRDDFHQAEETCDLSDAELNGHIGQAKRLANVGTVRHDQPGRPVDPWEYDRDYRSERVSFGARIIAGMLPEPGDLFVALRNRGFCTREIGALWPEIIAEAALLFTRQVR
jgi:hypothetical protein